MLADREREKTERWREHVLIEAGMPSEEARVIAIRLDIDVHYVLELIERGCPPILAYGIVL